MRTAYTEVGFLFDNEQLMGFSMGFDFCAQHENGQPWLVEQLGLPNVEHQDGLKTRTATQVPAKLRLFHFEHRARDKRFKKSMPAALLCLSRYTDDDIPAVELARQLSLSFPFEFSDKTWYKPDVHDVVSSWSEREGFGILVRGQKNVERLQELKEAFERCDIAFGKGGALGFLRAAPALVIASRVPPEQAAKIAENDRAHRVLQEAAHATGIYERLKSAGLGYYALSPAWYSEEGSELLFYLNPQNQRMYDGGWFTLDELNDWIAGKGPVVEGLEADKALKEQQSDFHYHLISGLEAQGLHLRVGAQAVWLDKERRQVGLRLLPHKGSEDVLPRGVYSLEQLMPYVEAGQATQSRPKAQATA